VSQARSQSLQSTEALAPALKINRGKEKYAFVSILQNALLAIMIENGRNTLRETDD
jgi:hypothetical protein